MATPTQVGCYTIPTKRYDGSGDDDATSKHTHPISDGESRQAESLQEDQDAFSRYSDDIQRMKALMFYSEDEDEDNVMDTHAKINEALRSVGLSGIGLARNRSNASKRRKGNSAVPINQQGVRKTRLTWELHPTLLMHDLMMKLDALENNHYITEADDVKFPWEEEEESDVVEEQPRPRQGRQGQGQGVAMVEEEDDDDE